jgi:hypothetical protein
MEGGAFRNQGFLKKYMSGWARTIVHSP